MKTLGIHLGDKLYVSFEGGHVVLRRALHPEIVTDRIALNSKNVSALLTFIKELPSQGDAQP